MPPYQYQFNKSRELVAQQEAALVEPPRLPRSKFHNRWQRITAFDAGVIIPFLLNEIYPGDHVSYNINAYVRLSTPLFPMFSNQRVDVHMFYCPTRLVWTDFEKMLGAQDTTAASIAYTVPQVSTTGGLNIGSLGDHLGLPFLSGQIDPTSVWTASSIPFRIHNFIYNEWYRDENLIDKKAYRTDSLNDSLANFSLYRRAKTPDYFASALPWPQKFTAPTVPLIGNAPITGLGVINNFTVGAPQVVQETNLTSPTYPDWRRSNNANEYYAMKTQLSGGNVYPAVYADLSSVAGVSINQLRQAWMIQQLLERDARGGTRFTEMLKSHWGVTSPDNRLNRPEYIGGGSAPLNLTPIAQTAPVAGVGPLGALGAAGTAAGRIGGSYAALEHGYVIGYISVKSELGYNQGLHRLWSRLSRYDFYVPALAQLGEQAILRQELYAKGSFVPGNDSAVFGYQERWQELRTEYSQATGIMRTFAAGTIDMWHLFQHFSAAPSLNQTFIEDTPDMARILAAGSSAAGQQYLADIEINRDIVRILPTYGTPALLGRF